MSEGISKHYLHVDNIKPPNVEGETMCIARWQIQTPHGLIDAYNREALEWACKEITAERSQREAAEAECERLRQTPETIAAQIVREVAQLEASKSNDELPDVLLVSEDELRTIILKALGAAT